MKTLPIVWQRLVTPDGTTCPRCHNTGEQILRAVERLKRELKPMAVIPALETRELDEAAFQNEPSESNRIWIAGHPIEYWLGGRTGSSCCCDECGGNECRTVELGGKSYEVIPEQLLVRAGLIAATRMLDPTLPSP